MLKTTVAKNYSGRRNRLMAHAPDACFIFFGASEVVRNNNYHYTFRQDSHFYYLSEFEEPGAILLLANGKSFLFCKERIEKDEVWNGESYGPARAKDIFGFDEAFSVNNFESKLDEVLSSEKLSQVYYSLGNHPAQDAQIMKCIANGKKHQGRGRHSQLPVMDPISLLSQLRMVKDDLEVDRLRKAAAASVKAHALLMRRARAGMNEKELFFEFQYTALKNGATDLGYAPIVAGGLNATTLHYVHNNETLKHGDLILIDAGAEQDYYTADVTHTFPVSDKFSEVQKLVYQKVLDCNRAVIAMMKPGVTYRQLHTRSVEFLTEALIELGVLSGTVSENIENKNYFPFYPHGVGHHLGLDVHDAGIYDERGKDVPLSAGMVLTVEPGLYFRDRSLLNNATGRFYGIGVRIEDDVLITATGSDVLTKDLPREIAAIEAARVGA